MIRPVSKLFGLSIILLSAFTLSACGAGVSQKIIRPVQIPQSMPVADVTALAAQSLANLNYRVTEMNPGHIAAVRSVPGDVWNRVTRMNIDVTPGAAGETLLNIEAFTCPGCVPQATFDPVFMINEFNRAFDAQALGAGSPGRPAAGQSAQTRRVAADERKAQEAALANDQRKVYLGIEMQNITPELASYLGMANARGVLIQNVEPKSPAEKAGLKRGDIILEADEMAVGDSYDVVMLVSKKKKGDMISLLIWRNGQTFRKATRLAARPDRPPQSAPPGTAGTGEKRASQPAQRAMRPSLQIQRIEVVPDRVAPGTSFDLKVDYTAADPASGAQEIPVQFSYSISEGGKLLHSQPVVSINAPNGVSTGRIEHLRASTKRGSYSIKATFRYQGSAVEESVNFTIE